MIYSLVYVVHLGIHAIISTPCSDYCQSFFSGPDPVTDVKARLSTTSNSHLTVTWRKPSLSTYWDYFAVLCEARRNGTQSPDCPLETRVNDTRRGMIQINKYSASPCKQFNSYCCA